MSLDKNYILKVLILCVKTLVLFLVNMCSLTCKILWYENQDELELPLFSPVVTGLRGSGHSTVPHQPEGHHWEWMSPGREVILRARTNSVIKNYFLYISFIFCWWHLSGILFQSTWLSNFHSCILYHNYAPRIFCFPRITFELQCLLSVILSSKWINKSLILIIFSFSKLIKTLTLRPWMHKYCFWRVKSLAWLVGLKLCYIYLSVVW